MANSMDAAKKGCWSKLSVSSTPKTKPAGRFHSTSRLYYPQPKISLPYGTEKAQIVSVPGKA